MKQTHKIRESNFEILENGLDPTARGTVILHQIEKSVTGEIRGEDVRPKIRLYLH